MLHGLLFKAKIFFFLIVFQFIENWGKETKISQFTLAYYYDALRNNHFADVFK
jgi:hypothetical protein